MAHSTMMRNCPVKIGIGRKTRISSGAFARPDGTARLTELISAINSLPPPRAASFSSHGKSGATEAAHRIQWQKGQAQKAWPFFLTPFLKIRSCLTIPGQKFLRFLDRTKFNLRTLLIPTTLEG